MAAVELEWIPETLYNTAISAVVDNYSRSRRDIRLLPENIQFDVYYKVRFTSQGAQVPMTATSIYEFV